MTTEELLQDVVSIRDSIRQKYKDLETAQKNYARAVAKEAGFKKGDLVMWGDVECEFVDAECFNEDDDSVMARVMVPNYSGRRVSKYPLLRTLVKAKVSA